jgi:hypothetical protein
MQYWTYGIGIVGEMFAFPKDLILNMCIRRCIMGGIYEVDTKERLRVDNCTSTDTG